jgi:hypothetical protein
MALRGCWGVGTGLGREQIDHMHDRHGGSFIGVRSNRVIILWVFVTFGESHRNVLRVPRRAAAGSVVGIGAEIWGPITRHIAKRFPSCQRPRKAGQVCSPHLIGEGCTGRPRPMCLNTPPRAYTRRRNVKMPMMSSASAISSQRAISARRMACVPPKRYAATPVLASRSRMALTTSSQSRT